ncbi:MAG: hypothetical protein R3228_19265, partial [Halioglobus sp.]|nr:hypothetical protein [Halioglobus sp.]
LRDMDADGRLDAVYAGRSGVGWFRNPAQDPEREWQRVTVTEEDSEYTFCDIDGDGMDDIVAGSSRYSDRVARWYRRMDASGERWQPHDIAIDGGRPGRASGMKFVIKGVACLRDGATGQPALVFSASGYGHGLFQLTAVEPTDAARTWQLRNLSPHQCGVKFDNVELADVDRDGDLDAVTTEEGEGVLTAGAGVIWFENTETTAPGAVPPG